MCKDPAFLFYSSDFLVGTSLMNFEQRGMYITLMCLQHQKGHLSEKDILYVCGTLDEDVISNFIQDENGKFYNERLEEEISKRHQYMESRRQNGRCNIKKSDIKNDENTVIDYTEVFQEFWREYPRKVSKQKAFEKYTKLLNDGVIAKDILDGLNRYKEYLAANHTEERFILHPTTWLNQRRWEDEYILNTKSEVDFY